MAGFEGSNVSHQAVTLARASPAALHLVPEEFMDDSIVIIPTWAAGAMAATFFFVPIGLIVTKRRSDFCGTRLKSLGQWRDRFSRNRPRKNRPTP